MSILTEEEIRNRLIKKKDLIITPLLELTQIKDGSVDIRLGSKFIDTRIRQFTVLDPPELSGDKIKSFQEKLNLVIGDHYTLHPGRLILASTFEFISLPNDLCGYVLSRSRYGRAGLMVATATYIHPLWQGCLTLELFNYGDFPIHLYVGSKVAQLILQVAGKISATKRKKIIPVGPEFTQMHDDDNWDKLRGFERLWKRQEDIKGLK